MQYNQQQRKLTLPERLDNIEKQQKLILNSIGATRAENIISHTIILSLIQQLIKDGKFEPPVFSPNVKL